MNETATLTTNACLVANARELRVSNRRTPRRYVKRAQLSTGNRPDTVRSQSRPARAGERWSTRASRILVLDTRKSTRRSTVSLVSSSSLLSLYLSRPRVVSDTTFGSTGTASLDGSGWATLVEVLIAIAAGCSGLLRRFRDWLPSWQPYRYWSALPGEQSRVALAATEDARTQAAAPSPEVEETTLWWTQMKESCWARTATKTCKQWWAL